MALATTFVFKVFILVALTCLSKQQINGSLRKSSDLTDPSLIDLELSHDI